MNRNATRLLKAIYDKTGGPSRGVRDVAELESGLTPDEARIAWQHLLDEGMITKFSLMYAARITEKGVEAAQTAPAIELNRPRVVVAHGQETAAPEAVALFLDDIGFETTRVHGPSVMEQIEKHGEFAFAIVVLTEDKPPFDVLMELGFLMGRFGRGKVCALAVDCAAELPGHLGAVKVEPFDASGNWKAALAGHLRGAS